MTLDIAGTLKTLNRERAHVLKELSKLEKAITAIRGLAGSDSTPNGHVGKRTMSAAARRKLAKAQKLRWKKFRKAKAAKG